MAKQAALTSLIRDVDRVCVDALMLPCADAESLTSAAGEALAAMLHGRTLAAADVGRVADTDRTAMLALIGRTREAAEHAIELAVRGRFSGDRQQFDSVRAAYLYTLHDIRCDLAETSAGDADEMRRRLCAAIGLLSVIDGDQAMAAWVKNRFVTYGSISPDDVNSLVSTVRLHLRRQLEEVLNLLDRRGGGSAVVRALRTEMKTETIAMERVAALGVSRSPAASFHGGYQAARLFGYLPDIGERLCFVQRRLIDMSYEDYVHWVTALRIDKERFHELLIAMSGARFALVDRDSAQALRRLLPPADGLRAGEVAEVRDLPGNRDAYPMHSMLPADEAVHYLSAHFAWAVAHANVAQLGEALLDWTRPTVPQEVRRTLSTIAQMGVYLGALGYRIAGEPVEFAAAVEAVCTGWARRQIDHHNAREEQVDADADRDWRDRYAAACGVADTLQKSKDFPGLAGTAFTQLVRQMHMTYGIYLANTFRDTKGAYEHIRQGYTQDDSRSLKQFMIAARVYGYEIWIPGGSQAINAEAVRVLEEAERVGEVFVAAHPNEGGASLTCLRMCAR